MNVYGFFKFSALGSISQYGNTHDECFFITQLAGKETIFNKLTKTKFISTT